MKVVFLQNVEGSGQIGEIKEVANGFARNYLLPRRLAAPATPDAIRRGEARAAAEARRQAELDDQARSLAETLTAHIVITARVGEQGRLYGSVTSGDIADEVAKLAGEEVDRHLLVLEEPIKQLGTYEIPVRLTRNVVAMVTVEVVGEEAAAEEEEEKEKKATKPRRKAKAASEEPEARAEEEPAPEEEEEPEARAEEEPAPEEEEES
jgi:large subunit ribosomal protein L9